MQNLRNHPDFKIERYSVARHNPIVRFTLWCVRYLFTLFRLMKRGSVILKIILVNLKSKEVLAETELLAEKALPTFCLILSKAFTYQLTVISDLFFSSYHCIPR